MNVTVFNIGGFQCNPQFQTKTLRVVFNASRTPDLVSIDTIEVQTRLTPLSTTPCIDGCPSLFSTHSCNTGRCHSYIGKPATCLCPTNASGPACEIFSQYATQLVDYTGGAYVDRPVGEPDSYGVEYSRSSGLVYTTYGFDLPVFLTSHHIFDLNNATLLTTTRVWVRENSTTSWYLIWDRTLGNKSTPLCQPNEMVKFLRIEYSLPPCNTSCTPSCTTTCTTLEIDTVQLTGST